MTLEQLQSVTFLYMFFSQKYITNREKRTEKMFCDRGTAIATDTALNSDMKDGHVVPI